MSTGNFYKLMLDLKLIFVPPMPRNSSGIIVSREVELPFPVNDGMRIYSRKFDALADPMGFTLNDVAWDIDREMFLANTSIEFGYPATWIPGEIISWLNRGWRLGSYLDDYPDIEMSDAVDDFLDDSDIHDEEHDEILITFSPSRRPKKFNLLIKALVRQLVDSREEDETTYAMDKSGRFFTESDIRCSKNSAAANRWLSLKSEYLEMSYEGLSKWRKRVSKYPKIDQVLK